MFNLFFFTVLCRVFCSSPRWGQIASDHHNSQRTKYVSKTRENWILNYTKGDYVSTNYGIPVDDQKGRFYIWVSGGDTVDFYLYSIDMETGKLINKFTLPEWCEVYGPGLIDGEGNYIIQARNRTSGDGGMIAIDSESGDIVWSIFPTEPPGDVAGYQAITDDGILVFLLADKKYQYWWNVYGFDLSQQKLVYSKYDFLTSRDYYPDPIDILVDTKQRIYFQNDTNSIYEVDSSNLKVKTHHRFGILSDEFDFSKPAYSASKNSIYFTMDRTSELVGLYSLEMITKRFDRVIGDSDWTVQICSLSEDESEIYVTSMEMLYKETKVYLLSPKNGKELTDNPIDIPWGARNTYPLGVFMGSSKYKFVMSGFHMDGGGALVVVEREKNQVSNTFPINGVDVVFFLDSSDCIYFCFNFGEETLQCNRKCL